MPVLKRVKRTEDESVATTFVRIFFDRAREVLGMHFHIWLLKYLLRFQREGISAENTVDDVIEALLNISP